MREIIIDTETTGLRLADGHRIIELAAVRLNGTATGETWHSFFNPGRDIEAGATAIHGITNAAVAHSPTFRQMAPSLLDFIAGAHLIAHNAPFDSGFLSTELRRAGQIATWETFIDTLPMARKKLPGKRHTLDALCDFYGISRARRKLHGAVEDCQLLAQVYARLSGRIQQLEMETGREIAYLSGGRTIVLAPMDDKPHHAQPRGWACGVASRDETAAHREFMKTIRKLS